MENSEKANKRLEHRGFTSKFLLAAAAVYVVTPGLGASRVGRRRTPSVLLSLKADS